MCLPPNHVLKSYTQYKSFKMQGSWEVIRSWRWSPMNGMSALGRREGGLASPLCHVRAQEDSCLQTSKGARTTSWLCLAPWSATSQPPELGEMNAEAAVCGIVITALDKGFPSPLSYLPRWWAFDFYPGHSKVDELPRGGQKGALGAQKPSTAPDLKFCLQHISPQKHADHT